MLPDPIFNKYLTDVIMQERERKQKLRVRAALGMNAKGIVITDTEPAFSLKELKLSKSKVDYLENAEVDLSSEEDLEFETSDEDVSHEDSDEGYDELLEVSMEKAYEEFLTRRGDDAKTRKAVKRTKVAKRALAGEALVQDSEMFDGDMKQYQKMIVPDEVCSFIKVYVATPSVLSVPGRSVPLLSCQTWGKVKWNAIMSDSILRLLEV